MKVSEIMSRKLAVVSPVDTVKSAANIMRSANVGILPVLSENRMIGIITDRDIVVRVVSEGKSAANCQVGDVMTEDVHYCLDDDGVEDVARRLGELRVRRMPVLDRSNSPVGIISLDDIAIHADWGHTVAEALRRIAAASPLAA